MLEELEDAIEGQEGNRRRRPPMDSGNQGPSDDVRGRPRNGGRRPSPSEDEVTPAKRQRGQNGDERQGPPRDSEVS